MVFPHLFIIAMVLGFLFPEGNLVFYLLAAFCFLGLLAIHLFSFKFKSQPLEILFLGFKLQFPYKL